MAALEFVGINDVVRFGICTYNPSGNFLSNTDVTPVWSVYLNDSDVAVLSGVFGQRGGMQGVYKSKFTASLANGFSSGDYVEVFASGLMAGVCGVSSVKNFVINDIIDANLTQISGVPVGTSKYIPDKVWDELQSPHNTNGTFGSGLFKVTQDLYYANIKFNKDSTVPQDEYNVNWFRNSTPLSSGQITNAAISVFKTDGTNTALFINKVTGFTNVNTGTVRYNENTNLAASGETYLAFASGTIDGGTRTWSNLIGLDYL